jgi:hypothetical protein
MSFSKPIGIAAMTLVCLSGGCSIADNAKKNFGEFAQRVKDIATNNTASDAAQKMEDPYFPDERRDGIARLANRSFGRGEPYTDRYRQIAQTDKDYLVRAAAIRALNHSRDESARPIFVEALDAPEPAVRLEAAKALANVPEESAIPKLLKIVDNPNENKDLRIAATDALKHYRRQEVARALVAQLNARDFSVAWQARQSLRALTGRDYQYDEAAWLGLFSGAENPLGG